MISLTITVDNISDIAQIFNTIQIRRYAGVSVPATTVTDLVAFNEYTTISELIFDFSSFL